jgi:hypothetical protein
MSGEILALTLLAALPGLLLSTLLTALSWLLAWLLLPAAALLTTLAALLTALVLLARLLFIRIHNCSLFFLPQLTTNASTLSSSGRWSASVQSARLRNVGMSELIGVAVMKTSCATKDLLRRAAGPARHALLIGGESQCAHQLCGERRSANVPTVVTIAVANFAAARRRAASCWSESVQSLRGVAYSRLPCG